MSALVVYVLSWDVRNANEQIGSVVFVSEGLALAQAFIWLKDSGLTDAEVEARMAQLRSDGTCEARRSDDSYSIAETTVRTEVTP